MTNSKKWNGQFVTDSLDIKLANEASGFQELLGMALRKNKKRAHLLVSTVLGKHIPQRPHIVALAAEMLAYQITKQWEQEAVGTPTPPAESADATRRGLRNYFLEELESSYIREDYDARINYAHDRKVTVFGYAETATGLGALVAEYIEGADYIHSTRYPVAGIPNYGSFDESHSHASVHHITPTDVSILDDPERSLVLVDDELSTGNTIMNTIRLFHSRSQHKKYYIATLTDLRTEEAHELFKAFEAELGIEVHVFSLISAELDVPVDSVARATPILDELKEFTEPFYPVKKGVVRVHKLPDHPGSLSVGMTEGMFSLRAKAHETVQLLSPQKGEKVLVLGIEEDMYFPLLVARELELHSESEVFFSSSTRSPVVTYNDEGYAIRERIRYSIPDDDTARYVYNVDDSYDRIILIMEDRDATTRHAELVDILASRNKTHVEIVEGQKAPVKTHKPALSSPEFGSYPTDDVQWLLKDLSNAELEAPTEEREEAIQNGGAHYAESLPVEFIPSEAYTELFKESLAANKTRLAEAVGVVSEQAYELRGGKPVLVSLARAGVPIGVLMKRYLKTVKNYNAPHYAISIVRGKGIDYNALDYIVGKHDPANVIFVDGWTGKGAITHELAEALNEYHARSGIRLSPELAVLADPGSCVSVFGTRDDYLIPSACLNSTVSGLISRTVLNEEFIQVDEGDYHGAKFYKEFAENDLSNYFIEVIQEELSSIDTEDVRLQAYAFLEADTTPTWDGWKKVEEISEEYGIHNVNLVKPGVGETTRVLLRRVPWKILVRPSDKANLKHILMLADERGVPVEEREDLPYACMGLIHPNYTKGATGFDGGVV